MEKSTRNPISLYNVIVTLIAIALFTALLKQCSEPVIATTDIDRIIDSMNVREAEAEAQISSLQMIADRKQDSIDALLQRRHETHIVYRSVETKVKELIETEKGCDSLKAEVNNLMELADDYQVQSDSMVMDYQDIINMKDSMLLKRAALYAALKADFKEVTTDYQVQNLLLVKANKALKRDKIVMGALAIVAGAMFLK